MSIDLVFITYNRLHYTQLSLGSILADSTEDFSLTIWDNASTDGTPEYLKGLKDPRIKEIVFSRENVGQTAAVNHVWSESKADLIGKLDNDCIVTPGWTRTLGKAHFDIEMLGVIACWHFLLEDFDLERARRKVQTIAGHQIFRHPWTCGTGLLIKRDTFQRMGPLRDKATTDYWLKMARAGYINGFYYPLVLQDHMDDPMSKYCQTNTESGFAAGRAVTVGLGADRYSNPAGRLEWRAQIISNLLDDPFDPAYYIGWRAKVRKTIRRVSTASRRCF